MWCIHSMPCFVAQGFIRLFQKLVPLSDSVLSGVPCCHKMCLSRPEMVSQAVAMVYRVCCQPASCCLYHGEYVMLVLVCPWQWSNIVLSARPHHIETQATALYSRGSLLLWLGWLQHMLLILKGSVQWPPWSGPPLNDEPIYLWCFST